MTTFITFKGIDATIINLNNNTAIKTVNVVYAVNSAFKHNDDYADGLAVKLFDEIYPVNNFYNRNELLDLFSILINKK